MGVPVAALMDELKERHAAYIALREEAAVMRGRLKASEIGAAVARKFLAAHERVTAVSDSTVKEG